MHLFRLVLIFLGVSCGLWPPLPTMAQLALPNQFQQPPEVTAEVVEGALTLDDARSATFHVVVHVPPDHHGYLDQGDEGFLIPFSFRFAPLEERGAQVVMLSHPAGERDDKVGATVLRGQGEFGFRLDAMGAAFAAHDALPATLRYQICNDVTNICYPPREIHVPIRFAGLAGTPGLPTATSQLGQSPASLTISERITALFQRYMEHILLALGIVFVAGLLASATPCVYPVLPITSAILMARGRGSRQRGQLHAVIYFLGLIFFYTLLGLVAALTGTALSTIMTSAWVNLGFAVVFAYFGLSMVGLYEFQFLPALIAKLDTASSQRQGFSGTFFMGTTAGLVVSPCVGPVVGAILLGITGQAAGVSAASDTGTAATLLRGVILMTGFGAGLGLPFLVVGLLSHWLPQSGQWLTRVKFILGLPILYFAYTYYLKGMEIAGIPENVAHAMLVGIIAIGMAMFIGAFHHVGEQPRGGLLLRRALGIILLIIGAHFLYNGLGQSGILIGAPARQPEGVSTTNQATLQTAPASTTLPPQVENHGNLRWLRDFPLAQQHARSETKPLFVDFYATWCANCKAFQRLAVSNDELNQALQQAVLVKIYDTDAIFQTFQQDPNYPELAGVGGQPFLPLFAIYSPQGKLTWKGQNYQAVQTMIAQLEHARRLAMTWRPSSQQ
jgi:thiol:disulfide interchange protein DsbD